MALDGRRMSHALILAAPTPEESRLLGLEAARTVLCERGGERPCGVCRACRKAETGVHPDLISVRRLLDDKGRPRKEIVVDQIREVSRDAVVLPNEARQKVYLIEEADRMNPAAQNAALKLLEEPPNGAVFLLCVTNPALLLPTVRSRCAFRRSAGDEAAPEEESLSLADDFLRTAASGDRMRLLRWCFEHEGMDVRGAQAFVEALRLRVTDMLCLRRSDSGFSRGQLAELSALAARCGDFLRVNTGVKHIFGLLAVDAPLGGRNRG